MKHAPGASIDVLLRGRDDGVEVQVVNGPAASGGSGLERAGGGHGLAGMRERVTQCGGTLVAGPTPQGGWQLLARFPHRTSAVPATRRQGG